MHWRLECGLPLDEPLRAANLYLKLNADDVREAFARSVRTDNLVQVVRGPAPQ
jgi:zinc protease